MHTFHVYRLWLCLCVVPVLLVGTKTKQQLLGVCFCILCARIRNYTSLKASARWKALILLASSRCLSFPDEMAAAATMTTTTTTQNNVHFNTAFNKIPVLRFLLASWYFWFCFSFGQNFIYIVADRREVSCLVHRIEPKRQGITLPLGRISLSFFFSRMSTSPRCFRIWTGFPLRCRLYIMIFSPVCLVVSEFRFG